MLRSLINICLTLLAAWSGISTPYASSIEPLPEIAIVIDDIGNSVLRDNQALRLPGPIAYAMLPYTPNALRAAQQAARKGKEIILHIPMEPVSTRRPGPGALKLDMTKSEFVHRVRGSLNALPNIIGVNNHMGSKLTQDSDKMLLLMEEIKQKGNLFFLDSLTTHRSLAQKTAKLYNVPTTKRDVFLDHEISLASIARSFEKLITIAQGKGRALAIGHPHPETLEFLEYWLPQLARRGVRLIPLSEYIEKEKRIENTWQASLSPLPPALKNSKP